MKNGSRTAYSLFNSLKNRPYSPKYGDVLLNKCELLCYTLAEGYDLYHFQAILLVYILDSENSFSCDLNIPLVLRTWRFKHGEKRFLLTSKKKLNNWRRRCIYLNTVTRRFIELSVITTELLVVVTTQQYVYNLNPTGKSKPYH